jgi:hypothetical protein
MMKRNRETLFESQEPLKPLVQVKETSDHRLLGRDQGVFQAAIRRYQANWEEKGTKRKINIAQRPPLGADPMEPGKDLDQEVKKMLCQRG